MTKKRWLIYSKKYRVDIGSHVFPTKKYDLLREKLIREKLADDADFIDPLPVTDEDLCLVHTKRYVDKMKSGKLSGAEIFTLELPYSKDLYSASCACVGGTILACSKALDDFSGIHLGGGFHHAFPDHGEGFCVFNDVAIGIIRLMKDGRIKKALVIDCDLHQGNGTAFIFQNNKDVFTFSIHQEHNYPFHKPKSSLDIGLRDRAGDSEYLDALRANMPKIISGFKPEFIMYVAGADPYKDDQIGNLGLTIEGLLKRDEFIYQMAENYNVPIAVVLAGGYARNIEDTVLIHFNTVKTALGYARNN